MTESMEYISDGKDGENEMKKFMKKFVKLELNDAKQLREKLETLDMLKLKPEYISKIIDILPENAENLNKIFTDVGLDEDETKKILDILKEFI